MGFQWEQKSVFDMGHTLYLACKTQHNDANYISLLDKRSRNYSNLSKYHFSAPVGTIFSCKGCKKFTILRVFFKKHALVNVELINIVVKSKPTLFELFPSCFLFQKMYRTKVPAKRYNQPPQEEDFLGFLCTCSDEESVSLDFQKFYRQ